MTHSKNRPDLAAQAAAKDLTDSAVADYLGRHPDFLIRHPNVLNGLKPPARWSGDDVVDMQHYLISRNRLELDELRDSALEVIETSRCNMSTQARAHAAVLALLATREWNDIVHVVTHDWPLLLDADVINLAFEPADRFNIHLKRGDLGRLTAGAINQILGQDQDVRLYKEFKDEGLLFGAGAGLVNSAALVRMRMSRDLPLGLLALGARGETFRPGQGTELLIFLCRVLEQTIARAFDVAQKSHVSYGDF